jgi:hypothetical protein
MQNWSVRDLKARPALKPKLDDPLSVRRTQRQESGLFDHVFDPFLQVTAVDDGGTRWQCVSHASDIGQLVGPTELFICRAD